MARPRKINQSLDVHLMLPEDLMTRVGLLLYSPLQQRVPLGALSAFFEQAARERLAQLEGVVAGGGEQ